ncbi:hypothetical protein KS4_27050 [Poriferisphaera corsica]|uniref:Secreted protein n=1 Tax=Poriferisphaera corsica TaxID=2528020 RepID=A0A517YWM9_9BACT|nr:hypothetical protein [Poriferisphaera corsica]QDU34634.1 hypothetical protein KS4_27050 [Poriferisphaera corsica]
MRYLKASLLIVVLGVFASCSDKSLVPGNDPYYSDPDESQEAQKLDEEEQYVDTTPTLNEEESGDNNLEYTMPSPNQYDE